jgi:hypothetical protein
MSENHELITALTACTVKRTVSYGQIASAVRSAVSSMSQECLTGRVCRYPTLIAACYDDVELARELFGNDMITIKGMAQAAYRRMNERLTSDGIGLKIFRASQNTLPF